VHPNLAATIFVMLAGLSAPSLTRSGRFRDHALLAALLVLTTVAVLSTQSRAGLAMLGVLGGGLLLVSLGGAAHSMRIAVATAVVVAGAVGLAGYERLPENRLLSDTTTLDSRQGIWAEAWDDFLESPLVGHGYDYSSGSRYGPTGQSVHSDYLGKLVDGGALGLAVLLAVLATVARLGWRASRRGGADSALGEGTLLLLAVLATSMLVNAPLATPIPSALLWLALGVGASLEAEPSS
jgi:O-antigen ligase